MLLLKCSAESRLSACGMKRRRREACGSEHTVPADREFQSQGAPEPACSGNRLFLQILVHSCRSRFNKPGILFIAGGNLRRIETVPGQVADGEARLFKARSVKEPCQRRCGNGSGRLGEDALLAAQFADGADEFFVRDGEFRRWRVRPEGSICPSRDCCS